MTCPFCKHIITEPRPFEHMVDCQRKETAEWSKKFSAAIAMMAQTTMHRPGCMCSTCHVASFAHRRM